MELQTPRCKCPGNTRWEQSFGEESRAVLDRDPPWSFSAQLEEQQGVSVQISRPPRKAFLLPRHGQTLGVKVDQSAFWQASSDEPCGSSQRKTLGGRVAESFWMHCFVGNRLWYWRPGGVVYSPIKGWEDKQNGISPYGAVTQLQSHETDISMETALLEWSQLFKQLE